jgi:hypothetical protein
MFLLQPTVKTDRGYADRQGLATDIAELCDTRYLDQNQAAEKRKQESK